MLARLTSTPKVSSGAISKTVPPQGPLGNGGVKARFGNEGFSFRDGGDEDCDDSGFLFVIAIAQTTINDITDTRVGRTKRRENNAGDSGLNEVILISE